MTTIQNYQQQPYTLYSHIKFVVFQQPLDFCSRLCSEKSGLDAGAKLYSSYYNVVKVCSEKYVPCKIFLENSFLPFKDVPVIRALPQFAESFNNSSDTLINLFKLSNLPGRARDIRKWYNDGANVDVKAANLFFNTIVNCYDSFTFVRSLANATKLGNYPKLFKCTAFALGCLTAAIDRTRMIKNDQLKLRKWQQININTEDELKSRYQQKSKKLPTLAEFQAKVARKIDYWENDKRNLENDRWSNLVKLGSLIAEITLILLQEFGKKLAATVIFGYSIPLYVITEAIYHLPVVVALANATAATITLHKFSFSTYFCKK